MEGGKSARSPSECLVCGDRASGRHYGVPSCDGCRGFFKRSVRRNLQYACKEGGRCTVDVARRNQCQACRLSKCLAVRMRKEAVQHERASRSQPKRRTVVAPPTAPPLAPSYCEPTVQYPGPEDNNDMKKTTPVEPKECPAPRHAPPRWDPPLVAEESAARLLFLCVRWVRGLPSFLQLGFRDQAILLEEAWPDLFVISAAQFGFPIHEGFVSLASLQSRPLVASQLHHMKSVLSQLLSQQVDPTEFSCLKALALFRPEAMGLRDPLQVELLQDQTQLMLHEYVLTRGGISPPLSTKVRFGKLLLSLAQLRRCSPQVIEELFFRRTIGSVPIERLLCDMFQAPNP